MFELCDSTPLRGDWEGTLLSTDKNKLYGIIGTVPYRTVLSAFRCQRLACNTSALRVMQPPPHAAKAHLNRKNLSDYCPTNKFKFAQPTKRDSCQLSVRLYYNIYVGVLSQEIDCFLLRGESKHRQQSSQE